MRSLVVLLLCLLGGCGASNGALHAQQPDPRIEAHWRIEDDAGIEVSGIGEQDCSVEPGLETVCVRGLRSAMRTGLTGVITPFMRVSETGTGAYLAQLRVRALGHGVAAPPEQDPHGPVLSRLAERPDLELWLAWTFRLFDRQGHTVL